MNRKIVSLGIGFASATFCLAPFAQAQQEENQNEKTHAVVTDKKKKDDSPQEMGAITVTATRQEEKVLDVPAVVSVITRERMEEHNVNNIQELVRYQPAFVSTDKHREPLLSEALAGSPFAGSAATASRSSSMVPASWKRTMPVTGILSTCLP